ncbi:hypothetical protein IFM89_037738 [Coptis chinensis]|uniref:Uncharacterized protein n=1 Tax=Coptis chinensis TaxID=261450 RepID=A0A835IV01_9MAGN|nr:hypothetical protein IFM89_037738 [Coptis chinensis]
MDLRYVIDVSSFFVVESSGDSEVDLDPIISTGSKNIALAENDAASCCDEYDVASMDDCVDIELQENNKEDCYHDNEVNYGSHIFGDGSWTCQKMDFSYQSCISIQTAEHEHEKQPKGGDDVSEELMNEEEKSRLFWITCLAL